jgi:hypothetical protein
MNDDGVVAFVGQVDGSTRSALFAGRDGSDLLELMRFSQFTFPAVRPQISDTGEIVLRDEAGAINVISSTGGDADIIAAAPGFDSIGDRPGISAEGRFVAFTGTNDGSPGVFLAERLGGRAEEGWMLVGTGAPTRRWRQECGCRAKGSIG